MVQEELVGPGIGSVDLAEVEEGDGKQEQSHGAQHAHACPLALLLVFPEGKGCQHGQPAKSESDQPESELMGSDLGPENFSQMDAAGQQSYSIADPAQKRTPRPQRDMQQHARQQAQGGKASRYSGNSRGRCPPSSS